MTKPELDVKQFCDNLKATKPPYECPVPKCGKSYRSWSGITYHLYNFDHDNPESGHSTPGGKKGAPGRRKGKFHHRSRRSPEVETPRPVIRDTLTYAEAQRLVEVEVRGQIRRINIYEPLQVISKDRADIKADTQIESKKVEPKRQSSPAKLPEAQFKVLSDYPKPAKQHVQPTGFFRYIEKSNEELDEEVEYDMDDQDYCWLDIINSKRKKDGNTAVSQDTFEFIMDRFEKEAHFHAQSSGTEPAIAIDEDAVCCICMDGECQNSNVILFCDMCDLAVHQECYGVPYIPEGQWLCRRCLQSPSRAVDCVLCPNKGGAFKQTEDNRWAHVMCAIWIPEVIFANTVFLEPVDGIENIPAARWKLTCYICKQKNLGACIQCHKTNCYTAFHVTCAQQAGLYMKVEQVKSAASQSPSGNTIRKTAFCDVHTPMNMKNTSMVANTDSEDEKSAQEKARIKMRKARKILAEKRNAKPVINIPIIPEKRLEVITKQLHVSKKQQLLELLIAYWTLKRQSRNGVPLIRRLQSSSTSNIAKPKDEKAPLSESSEESQTMNAQFKYWKRLRQDLEKARLLVELIRKREKLKREQLRLHSQMTELQLSPFNFFIRKVFNELKQIDSSCVFMQPVDISEVPDYLEYIKTPMDMSTMSDKIDDFQYNSLDEFEADIDLMISNCMVYNSNDTPFYKAALKMKEQGGSIMRAARRMYEFIGFDLNTGLLTSQRPEGAVNPYNRSQTLDADNVDKFVENLEKSSKSSEDRLKIMVDELDYAILDKGRKSKVSKVLRKEILTIRKELVKGTQQGSDFPDDTSALDTDTNRAETPSHLPVKSEIEKERSNTSVQKSEQSSTNSTPAVPTLPSPGSVNRRTAVLFASKKLRRPSPLVKSPIASPLTPDSTNKPTKPADNKPASPSKSSHEQTSDDKMNTKKRSAEAHSETPVTKKVQLAKGPSVHREKDSFTKYRSLTALSASELDEISTTDSDVTETSQSDSSETETSNTNTRKLRSAEDKYNVTLTALDLVWAKCRGYPWYPAMIIDPKVPTGYTFNGVPIPKPPQSVLDLQTKFNEKVFLILFFDARRTWQWLPRDKLEPLGVDSEYDQQKLSDNRKPNIRKAVMGAYEKALRHQRKIDDGDDDDDDDNN